MTTFRVSVTLWLGLSLTAIAQNEINFSSVSAAAATARISGTRAAAVALYTQAVALRPDWQEGWWFLGVLRYGADEYSLAIEALDHVLH